MLRPAFAIPLCAAALLSLSACQEPGPRESLGAIGGAILGGLAGAQFGSGTGQIIATGVGASLGLLVGREIGRQLDEVDRLKIKQSQQAATQAPIGDPILWSNPDSGNSGSVTPVREGYRDSGEYCREFRETVMIGNEQEEAYGVACRQPDGTWKIQ